MALKGTVTTAVLNVRKTTSTALKAIGQIKRGTVVDVLDGSDENWSKIRLADGTEAYVATDYLNIEEVADEVIPEPEPTFEPYKVVITTQSLNVRPLAGTSKPSIGAVKIDKVVTVLEELGEWYRISYADDDGYIHASFTRKLLPGEKITRGYLIEDAELMSIPLVPDHIIPTDDLEARKRPEVTARIWNENGNLISALADRYNIPIAAIVGVIGTESAGNFFHRDTNKVTIRFENHQFYKYWGKLNETLFDRHFQFSREAGDGWKMHKFRANIEEEWDWVHNGQEREHEILEFARSLDNTAALKSISMGGPQIMGFNYSRLGYESVQQMYDAFARSSHAQILGLFDFVKGSRATSAAIEALQKRDFFTFASHYNGSGREAIYEDLMESFATHFDTLIKTAVKVEPVQIDATENTETGASAESGTQTDGGDSPSEGVPVDIIAPKVVETTPTDSGTGGEVVTTEPELDPVMAIPTARLNFRADKKTSSESYGLLERNVPVKIAGDVVQAVENMGKPASAKEWVFIENTDGKQGYAAAWYLKPSRSLTDAEKGIVTIVVDPPVIVDPDPVEPTVDPEPKPVITDMPEEELSVVPTMQLNFRGDESTDNDPIGILAKGTPLKILEDEEKVLEKMGTSASDNQWIKVEDSNGLQGYAAAWLVTPSRQLTQAGVDARINALPDVTYPSGYEYLWTQQEKLGLPDPFDVLPVQISSDEIFANMQVNGYGPNTFALWNWQNWYSRIGGMHNGYDFIVKTGTPMLAVSDGVIIKNWLFMSNSAEITTCLWCFLPEKYRDSKGRRMMSNVLVAYGHLSSNKERAHKEVVKAGDVIGLGGTPAGMNYNDHLHYEVHLMTGDMDLSNRRSPRKLLSLYNHEQPMDNNTPWNPLLFYSKRLVNYQVYQGEAIGYPSGRTTYPDYPTIAMMKARGTHHLPEMDQFTLGYYRYGLAKVWNKPSSGTWGTGIVPTEMLEERIPTFDDFEPYEATFLGDE